MEDAALDPAPVWDDVATFDGRPWRGAVDIVTAGYPCQPFSVAGKRRGADDPRHLWPHVARIIGEAEPPFVFLENVAHHLRLGFPEVAGGLVGMGYRLAAGLFTAAEVGAPHKRERLFILAHRERDHLADPARLLGTRSSGGNRTEMMRHWPTPLAGDSKGTRNRTSNRSETARPRNDGTTLCDATRMWMTPTARDHKDGATSLANTPVNGLLGRQVLVTPTAGGRSCDTPRTLNPQFVEALMGWPTGWTGFGSVATAWSRWSRRMRSELSQLNCWPMDKGAR